LCAAWTLTPSTTASSAQVAPAARARDECVAACGQLGELVAGCGQVGQHFLDVVSTRHGSTMVDRTRHVNHG